jgi:glycosyltransferase involved in cell wall biosynthesis
MSSLLDQLPSPPSGRTGWPWTEETSVDAYAGKPDWPRITLVTPSFNQGAFIEQTLRSVLLQNYPNLEYIVVDGGSTDSTIAILKKYSRWITHWVSEPDDGQSHAINKGLARATGEWFNWINSDDFLAPGALDALARATLTPGLVVASGVTANLRGETIFSRYRAHVPTDWPATLFLLRVNQPGSLLRLSAVRAAGGVRQDLRLVMDLDLWLRLARCHGSDAFACIDTEVACYRYHEASKTCAGDDIFAVEEFALLVDLAASLPGLVLPAGIRTLRAQCAATNRPIEGIPIETAPAERAWLNRLVVSDSLLFRALRKTLPPGHDSFPSFGTLLDELTPALRRHHAPAAIRRILVGALVHAMEIEGRLHPASTLRALVNAPHWSTVRALARLAFRR